MYNPSKLIHGSLVLILMQEKDDLSFTDNDLGCDFFPLGACI